MGASASTPLPAASTGSTPPTPKADLDDLRFFGHAPAAEEKDHSWFFEVVSSALLGSARRGEHRHVHVPGRRRWRVCDRSRAEGGRRRRAVHPSAACVLEEYRAAVVKELVDACESFDYSPRDILSALESHVDRASPSELDATPGRAGGRRPPHAVPRLSKIRATDERAQHGAEAHPGKENPEEESTNAPTASAKARENRNKGV